MHVEITDQMNEITALLDTLPPEKLIFGASLAMQKVRDAVVRVSRTSVPVLIQGEGGTGKGVVARLIHHWNPGEIRPFILAGNSEIQNDFLRRLGTAPPDALPADVPSSARVCGGTLFVREVGELTRANQRKLMRHLSEGALTKSAPGQAPGHFRLICTTTRPLDRAVESGGFLRGLFHSISIVSLDLPALRERREDIPEIVVHLWKCYKSEFGSESQPPSERLIETFQQHNWPGNLRELAGVVKRYSLLGSEEAILSELEGRTSRRVSQLRTQAVRGESIPLKKLVKQAAREVEQKIILRTLRDHCWNRKQTAQALNISYRALLYKAKEAGVRPKKARGPGLDAETCESVRIDSETAKQGA